MRMKRRGTPRGGGGGGGGGRRKSNRHRFNVGAVLDPPAHGDAVVVGGVGAVRGGEDVRLVIVVLLAGPQVATRWDQGIVYSV